MLFSVFASFITSAIILSLSNSASAATPYSGSTSVFVSYSNAAINADLHESPKINVGFGSKNTYTSFIMDTGSVGIVASPDIFQPEPGAINLGPGQQIYSSSGIIENGTWWTATQKIYDENGNLLATSNVPVLQVTSITCTKDARSCMATDHPTNISVMGIGFARESKEQTRGTPAYNAFLNLQTVFQNGVLSPLPSDWTNGYVVTPDGVDLGLTAANTANAGWVQLAPWPAYSTNTLSEWMAAPMTISTNGISGNGNVLMDTGVASGFLTPPPGVNLGKSAPNGTVIDVFLPNEQNPVAFYTFTVGQAGNLMEPDGVIIVGGSNVFFNTSRHVLLGIDFIYDNTNGYIGYIWNGLSGSNVGYVKPSTPTTTTLTSPVNPVKFGKNATFIATVVGDVPSATPTGNVTFVIDNKSQYSVPLDQNGTATFSISTLPPVQHSVVAKYSGDSNYIHSKSSGATLKVKPPTCF